MASKNNYKVLGKKFLILGIISLILLSVFSPMAPAAQSNGDQPTRKARINSELMGLLIDYQNGLLNPDEQVEVIIEFRNQSQNKLVPGIRSQYESQRKVYSGNIKGVLKKYEQNGRLPSNFPSLLSPEDETGILNNARAIEALEANMRREIKSILATEISMRQQPFVQLVEQTLGGTVLEQFESYNILLAKVAIKNVEKLINNEDVSGVILNVIHEDAFDLHHSAYAIDADVLWDDTANGGAYTNVDVAIVDTGVNHSETLDYNSTGSQREWIEQSWVDHDNDGTPDEDEKDYYRPGLAPRNGHGTPVAGIIGSSPWNSNIYTGVAYDIETLINAKAGNKTGWSQEDDALDAINWAVYDISDVAEVVSNSYGYSNSIKDGESTFSHYIDAISDDSGAIFVFSAGNDGPTPQNPDPVKTIKRGCDTYNGICVGASADLNDATSSNPSRENDHVSAVSSRGPTDDDRKKPDLIAPGELVCVVGADGTWDDCFFIGDDVDGYTGTSFATPHISGVAALLMKYALTAKEVKALLINTAEDCKWQDPDGQDCPGDDGWDKNYGWGYVDLGRAHSNILNTISDTVYSDSKFYKADMQSDDTATLVWNRHIYYDKFSNTVGAIYDLNNLDLYLYKESDNSKLSESISLKDNVEQVKSSISLSPGIIKVSPTQYAAGQSSEDYALSSEGSGFTAVNPPSFSVSVTYPPIIPDSQFAVNVEVTNDGHITAHDVYATIDQLPPGFSIVSGSNPQSLGSIGPSSINTATWIIQAPFSGGGTLDINVSSISYGETFGTSHSEPLTTGGGGTGDVTITTSKTIVDPSETFTLTVEAKNLYPDPKNIYLYTYPIPNYFDYCVNVAPNDVCTRSRPWSENIPGTYTYTGKALYVGELGLEEGNSVNVTVVAPPDTTPPTITVTSPTNTTYSTVQIDLNVSADEAIDTWMYSLNGDTNVTFTPNTTITAPEGVNNITVYANDTAGNTGSATVWFTVSAEPPLEVNVFMANYSHSPGENIKADIVVSNWGTAPAAGIANITMIAPNNTVVNTTTRQVNVGALDAELIRYEYSMPGGAQTGLWRLKAKIEGGDMILSNRWFEVT